jgi:sigma-E factor negative regulatory protein RseA
MSQQIREQLSALMDGELQRDETLFLLRRVEHDRSLAGRWASYHVTRHALRRQEIGALRNDFASVVLSRIEAEALPEIRRSVPWMRWASGGAIAASVAVAALVATTPRGGQGNLPGEQVATLPATVTQPASVSVPSEFRPPMLSPSLAVQPASATTGGYATQSTPIDPRLQSYLIRHYDAAGSAGQSGLMPYVLLIVPSQQQAVNAAESTAERR